MADGFGFGKTILFGDHFVGYGLPSIASALDAGTVVEVVRGKEFLVEDKRPETPGYKSEKRAQMEAAVRLIFDAVGVDPVKERLTVRVGGDLVATSGIGASGAFCVGLARALCALYGIGCSDERINEIGYEGEKGFHGNPSGVDNTVSTYGGVIRFVKAVPPLITRLELRRPVEAVLCNTGLTTDTAKAVALFRASREKEPGKFEALFSAYARLETKAEEALAAADFNAVGALMDENHALLREAGMSCEALDRLVGVAKAGGALGAKLTGSGLGGLAIALSPGRELQKRVARAVEEAGFTAMLTLIGSSS
jgi:mevalonate kinase